MEAWSKKFLKYSDELATLDTTIDAVRSFAIAMETDTKLIKKGKEREREEVKKRERLDLPLSFCRYSILLGSSSCFERRYVTINRNCKYTACYY